MAELSLRLYLFPIKVINHMTTVIILLTELMMTINAPHRQADGLVLVFSLDRPSSFEEVNFFVNSVDEEFLKLFSTF